MFITFQAHIFYPELVLKKKFNIKGFQIFLQNDKKSFTRVYDSNKMIMKSVYTSY